MSLKGAVVTFAVREENHGRVSSGKRQCVQKPFFPLTTVSAVQTPHHKDTWHQHHHTCLQLATSCFWLHSPPLSESSCLVRFYPVDRTPIWALSRQLLQENVLGNNVKALNKIHINNTHSLFLIHWSPCQRRWSGWSRGAAFHKGAWWPHCPASTTGWHWDDLLHDIPQYLGQANRPAVPHILLLPLLLDGHGICWAPVNCNWPRQLTWTA